MEKTKAQESVKNEPRTSEDGPTERGEEVDYLNTGDDPDGTLIHPPHLVVGIWSDKDGEGNPAYPPGRLPHLDFTLGVTTDSSPIPPVHPLRRRLWGRRVVE